MKNKENLPSSEYEYKNRFDVKTLIMIMMIILLVTIIILWNPTGNAGQQTTETALTTQSLPNDRHNHQQQPVPLLPPEISEYQNQTNGIVLGSVIIVLIIIGGTLGVIQRRK
jgi:hypothetical protein